MRLCFIEFIKQVEKEIKCETRQEFKCSIFSIIHERECYSIYHMTLILSKKSHFWRENVVMTLPSFTQRNKGQMDVHYVTLTTSVLTILLHGLISLPAETSLV